MIELADRWVWDSWYSEHDGIHHAFFLAAPRSLGDPDLRHVNAVAAHATSTDLVTWMPEPDALHPGAAGAFDDLAIWTGSVVRVGDVWHWFYTGIGREHGAPRQRIGHATSTDLRSWQRGSVEPVVSADPRWYTTMDAGDREEPWRDPWVFRLDDGWHMLITAFDRTTGQGAIAHATSPDLDAWTVHPPLSGPTGFAQLEVLQVVTEGDRHALIFCANARDVLVDGIDARHGTYCAPADSPLGPYHLDRAEPIAGGGLYAGRIVRDGGGRLALLGFIDDGTPGGFRGVIADPVPLDWTDRGTLQPHPRR